MCDQLLSLTTVAACHSLKAFLACATVARTCPHVPPKVRQDFSAAAGFCNLD